MGVKLANNARSRLSGSISAVETTITVLVGHGVRFPATPGNDDWYPLALESQNGDIEYVKCIGRNGDALYVERGQEGTQPRAFTAGDLVQLRLTAKVAEMFGSFGTLYYRNGEAIDDYMPQDKNATNGAPPGTKVGNTDVEDVLSDIEDAKKGISDLIETYGSTAAAAASAQTAEQAKANAESALAAAQSARDAASNARQDAIDAALASGASASAASASAIVATQKSDNASSFAAASQASAVVAEQKAGDAGIYSSAAQQSAVEAAARNSEAATSASAAAQSESTAAAYRSDAASSAAAAATSATNAQTQASNASTSASQASTSATNAAGSSATASDYASNAANSMAAASGSASAAGTSASIASTQAGNAANSAVAAQFSSVTAQSHATGNVVGKSTFEDGKLGGWGPDASVVGGPADPEGRTLALRVTNRDTYEGDLIPGRWASRRLRCYGYAMSPGAYPSRVGVQVLRSTGEFAYPLGDAAAPNTGHWQWFDFTIVLPPDAVRIRPMTNSDGPWGAGNHDARNSMVRIEDYTSQQAMNDSASAAATSASSAATSASNAGIQAAAAENHAVSASVNAGNAATSSSAAASSASVATAQASAAQTNATLAATAGLGTLNPNPTFTEYPGSGEPAYWIGWDYNSGNVPVRATGENGVGYSLREGAAPNMNQGGQCIGQGGLGNPAPDQWFIMEAHVRLEGGSLRGSGIWANCSNASGSEYRGDIGGINFAADLDSSGNAPGDGVAGRVYRFTKLVRGPSNPERTTLYRFTNWDGFGTRSGKVLQWFRISIRPATAQEIRDQTALQPLIARVSEVAGVMAGVEGTVASHETRLQASEATAGSLLAAITGVDGRTTTYWEAFANDPQGRAYVRLQNRNGVSQFIVGTDLVVLGDAIFKGSVRGEALSPTDFAKRINGGGAGSPNPGEMRLLYAGDMGITRPNGSYSLELSGTMSTNVGRVTSNRNGRPFYTNYLPDGGLLVRITKGGVVIAEHSYDAAEYGAQNGAMRTLSLTVTKIFDAPNNENAEGMATLLIYAIRGNQDTGIVDDGDYYFQNVSAFYNSFSVSAKVKWMFI